MEWGGCARDNPMLQRQGIGHPIPPGLWFAGIPPLLEKSIPNLTIGVHHPGRPCTAGVIEAQQESPNSLGSMVLQNRPAPDSLTAEVGGACAPNKETCSMWISTSSQVEENLHIIKKNITLSDHRKHGQDRAQLAAGILISVQELWSGLLPFLSPPTTTFWTLPF